MYIMEIGLAPVREAGLRGFCYLRRRDIFAPDHVELSDPLSLDGSSEILFQTIVPKGFQFFANQNMEGFRLAPVRYRPLTLYRGNRMV